MSVEEKKISKIKKFFTDFFKKVEKKIVEKADENKSCCSSDDTKEGD